MRSVTFPDSLLRIGDRAFTGDEACYEPEEPIPEEFVEKPEPKKTLENTAHYATDIDGTEYYYCGNSCIHITEHFAEEGKTVGELMEELILRKAKGKADDNALNR